MKMSSRHSSIAGSPTGNSIHDEPVDSGILKGRTLFIGLGAMKAGTSWVSSYLRAHPEVYHSPVKEMNFFNRFDNNGLESRTKEFWRDRTRKIILEKAWSYPPNRRHYELLKAFAELEVATDVENYTDFFARRINKQRVFGEICPQYALLSPQTLNRIQKMGFDTRFLFFMRDPTDRLASNIQHKLRRKAFDVDEFIEQLQADTFEYVRSNYELTLRRFSEAKLNSALETFVYEELFTPKSIERLCHYLGIQPRRADFSRLVNSSRGPYVTDAQKAQIREKLDPIYQDLDTYFGAQRPHQWRW